jgi:hypothetical protein
MTEKQMNDIFYVCSLIEYIARKTKNHRQDVIRCFSKKDIERQIYDAEVNHCLSFEQVSEELIDWFNIPDGNFDTVAECRYEVPSATSIGMLYQGLVLSTMKNDEAPTLKTANFGYGKFISCSLTETSGQKLLPKNMLQTDPVAPRTPIWMEVAAGLTMTARA